MQALPITMSEPRPKYAWDPIGIIAEMEVKRTQVVEVTKNGRAYAAMQEACENNSELVRPKTHDPHRPQSKRSWETLMLQWKEEIRKTQEIGAAIDGLVQKLQD